MIQLSSGCWPRLTRSFVKQLRMACSGVALSPEQPVVNVRRPPGEKHMDLCFTHHDKQFKMHRPVDEPLGKTLKRMLISVSKPAKHLKRKHAQTGVHPPAQLEVSLSSGCDKSVFPEDVLNKDVWVEGSLLVVGGVTYTVHVNSPTVVSLRMPEFAAAGGALVPEVELEFTDLSLCKWTWRRLPLLCNTVPLPIDLQKLPLINTALVYWPSQEDVGHRLVVECVPSPSSTQGSKCILSPVIADLPKDTPITRRQLFTPARLDTPGQFRAVTYNLLAEPFSNSDHARNVLYPYCDPTALNIDYRQCLIAHELLGYNADVLCLQEVGTRTYERYLSPAFRDKGYDGCFAQKSGMVTFVCSTSFGTCILSPKLEFGEVGRIHEGEAIFFETSKFTLVDSASSPLSTFFENDPSCISLYQGLSAAPFFFHEVIKKHNIVLSVLLKSQTLPNQYLFVATTHLYYHPKGDHVRLVQVAVMLNYLNSKLEAYRQKLGEDAKIATLVAGDFNSCPCIAAYEYVVGGQVRNTHQDWMVYKLAEIPKCQCAMKQRTHKEESYDSDDEIDIGHRAEASVDTESSLEKPKRRFSTVDDFKGLNLDHKFHFWNACGTSRVTNYTLGYSGILDYIFIDSDHLSVERTIPLPSHSEMSEFVALPSVYFPSDHVSLVVDLNWKQHIA